ncbi:MAG: hypothetical protein K6A36_05635 [Paludibacteraceae bacterium]|nr:hypothetical protein [Paludibacteraceae bacterium]
MVHNPYVKDDDVLAISATDGDKVVGYTAIFPEHIARPDRWIATGTTLWVNPDYADDFVGYNLVQRLWQSYPQCAVIGSDVSRPAATIDKLLGATITKCARKAYVLNRTIEIRSLRNLGSFLLEPFRKCRQKKAIRRVLASISSDIHVETRNTIDAKAYEFIQAHSVDDTFLRSREMLNWIIQYPFSVENPLQKRQKPCGAFQEQTEVHRNYLLYIYHSADLVGIVLLAQRAEEVHVKMLYADETYQQQVFAVIVEATLHIGAEQLYSLNPRLNEYIESAQISLKTYNRDILFTYPKTMTLAQPLVLQGIEGDMFA